MGMFDYVVVECELPDASAKDIHEWQTKDFDWPMMEKYRITADGRLMEELYHREDRSDPNAPPGSWRRIAGCATPVHEGWRDMNFHGVLNFIGIADYDRPSETWFEYNATFTHGQLEKIERVAGAPPSGGTET